MSLFRFECPPDFIRLAPISSGVYDDQWQIDGMWHERH